MAFALMTHNLGLAPPKSNSAHSHQMHTLIVGGLTEAPISEPQVSIIVPRPR